MINSNDIATRLKTGGAKMLRLEKLRKLIDVERGLKRNWVAEKIGMAPSSFKSVITGNAPLSLEKAQKLAKLLGVKVSEIWEDKK